MAPAMMLTTQQAAEIIGCGRRHVNKLCDAGKIECRWFGRVLQVEEESARAYAENPDARKPGPRRRLDEYGWVK
jgi:excisionase family DNA binding protein